MNHHYESIESLSAEGWERTTPLPFRHFDYFTLQRSLPALKDFLAWKEKESSRLCSNPLYVGTTFKVSLDGFSQDQFLLRSSFPHQPLPQETIDAVGRSPRPRNESIDEFLTGNQNLFFKVTKIVRHMTNTFSQSFVGVLCTEDGLESPPLFLKLFVEGFFPVKKKDLLSELRPKSQWFKENPAERLLWLNLADDMLKREQFAYDRLRAFQGTLLPHQYGIHTFTLDGVLSSYGMLLEIIPNSPLSKVRFKHWKSKSRQAAFIRQLRHCLKVLLYAGINQRDFHADQILLPQGRNYSEETGTIVFIDFAFAPPRLGDEQADKIVAKYSGNSWGDLWLLFADWGVLNIMLEEYSTRDLEEL
ncbi:hypothetical protein C8Q75DRAFT_713489 [Abortiporus biennis]|nr:hypothetical protein C8Q75DRAFT_713801 [Abortiporus biennis]KAI0792679.1 hypothetical protein C8Q75DRAFT_713489 [Abortiporus biennis]